MTNKLRIWIFAMLFATTAGGVVGVVAVPQPAYAACSDRLLTFPAWYQGLTDSDCNIKSPADVGGLSPFIWRIVLNVLETMLQLVGYISVGYLIFGGFKYMTALGEAGNIVKAKDTIKNAIIGLVIAVISIALVNFIVGAF